MPCYSTLSGTKFCTHGVGATVGLNASGTAYDYATYWGAALAMDLNESDSATRGPYVASQHGVVGFSFNLTNNLPASKVRFSFEVWNGSALVPYCVDALNPGQNVVHFSNATQNCYQTGGTALTTTVADGLEALQWQVPTSPNGTTSYDYCIDSLTPLTQ